MAVLTGHVWQDHTCCVWDWEFNGMILYFSYISCVVFLGILTTINLMKERLAKTFCAALSHTEREIYMPYNMKYQHATAQTHGGDRNYILLITIYSISLHGFYLVFIP